MGGRIGGVIGGRKGRLTGGVMGGRIGGVIGGRKGRLTGGVMGGLIGGVIGGRTGGLTGARPIARAGPSFDIRPLALGLSDARSGSDIIILLCSTNEAFAL
jgi:hypothetical protein